MNTLKILIITALTVIFFASCSEDLGIDIKLMDTENLEAEAGDSLDFSLQISAEEGISQIVVESKELGLDYLENTANSPGGVLRKLTAAVPSDAKANDTFNIKIDVSDSLGNTESETMVLSIK